jgi:hypothetical protein
VDKYLESEFDYLRYLHTCNNDLGITHIAMKVMGQIDYYCEDIWTGFGVDNRSLWKEAVY